MELYAHIPPPGWPIAIEVAPFPVDDNIPRGGGVVEAMLRLQLHRAGGPPSIRAKHLSMWLCAATQEEDPDPGNWNMVIVIIQAVFREG